MLNKFNKTVDSLPLAGKYATEPAMKSYIRAEPKNEKSRFAKSAFLLGAFVLAHASNAKTGVDSFANHLESFSADKDSADAALMAVDSAYALVNASVAVRQAELLHTLRQVRQRKLERWSRDPSDEHEPVRPSGKPPTPISEATKRDKMKALGLALAVTLGGQAAFSASHDDGEEKAARSEHSHSSTKLPHEGVAPAEPRTDLLYTESLLAGDTFDNTQDVEPNQLTPPTHQ